MAQVVSATTLTHQGRIEAVQLREHQMTVPRIVSQDEWLAEHMAFLEREEAAAKERATLNEARRALPMVEVTKTYAFEGPNGDLSLLDLFEGRRQLIVYHFMFDPEWEEGCRWCSYLADNVGNITHL